MYPADSKNRPNAIIIFESFRLAETQNAVKGRHCEGSGRQNEQVDASTLGVHARPREMDDRTSKWTRARWKWAQATEVGAKTMMAVGTSMMEEFKVATPETSGRPNDEVDSSTLEVDARPRDVDARTMELDANAMEVFASPRGVNARARKWTSERASGRWAEGSGLQDDGRGHSHDGSVRSAEGRGRQNEEVDDSTMEVGARPREVDGDAKPREVDARTMEEGSGTRGRNNTLKVSGSKHWASDRSKLLPGRSNGRQVRLSWTPEQRKCAPERETESDASST